MGRTIKGILIAVFILLILGAFYMTVINKDSQNKEVQVETFTADKLSNDEYDKLDKETQDLAKQYKYNETFDSFENLAKEKQKDGSYIIPKYDKQPLYLVIASKKNDGTIFALFDDKE